MAKDELALVDVMEKAKVYVFHSSFHHINPQPAFYVRQYTDICTAGRTSRRSHNQASGLTSNAPTLLPAQLPRSMHEAYWYEGEGSSLSGSAMYIARLFGCYEVEL